MFEITKGKLEKPVKVCLYAPEGIGKTTFASKFPSPVFIDTEGGSNHLDVNRLPSPSSWSMLMEEIKFVKDNPDICRTLVIDTVDWADQLCVAHVCAREGKHSIEDYGYGRGYVFEAEEFVRMLHLLDDVIDVGVNVVLCAHSMLRKFEQPDEFGSYDRYELKIGTKTGSRTAALIKEWCDMLLFANYQTIIVKDGNKKSKATGGQRVMHATHHPAWDAKNRFGLPDKMPFDYAQVAHCIPNIEVTIPKTEHVVSSEIKQDAAQQQEVKVDDLKTVPKALADLMVKDNVSMQLLQSAVAAKGIFPKDSPFSSYPPEFIDYLISDWPKFLAFVNTLRAPF